MFVFQENSKDAYAHITVEVTLFQFTERDPVGYSMFCNLKGAVPGIESKVLIVFVLGIIHRVFFGRCAEHDVVWLVIFA